MTLLLLILAAGAAQADFRAAAVKVDITPKTPQPLLGYAARTSTGVHDAIFHRVIAMDDGLTQFYLAATDIALVSPSIYDDFCKDLEKETGIGRKQVWWTVTHTHSAPEVGPPGLAQAFLPDRYHHQPDWEYAGFVKRTLIDAIKKAKAALAPARLRVGKGFAMANINRRARGDDGKIRLGLNPYGPVDREIGLLRVEQPDGKLIALVMNYAMHGTALGGANTQISGDAPGVVTAYLEQKLGGTVLYVNGAAGNIAPIYSVYPDFRSAHLNEFPVLLGDRVVEELRRMPAPAEVRFETGERILETPRKAGLGWAPDLGAYAKNGSKGPLVRLPLRFLRVNRETAIWAAPLEMFCELALAVRDRSPFANTFFFGYANGWLGYLPTKAAFAEGGYEPGVSPFTDRAEAEVVEAALKQLQSLRK
ncbi:MAG: neutral/alkaline non-lysosomal ceramidase N-terminal domain-containing protein [Bryobacteraceae bacterium]|nr:neutral/alkaline non-lysosomal ceramidase N-terminal domain-containing protein [Bryobacteraceae bacterium]